MQQAAFTSQCSKLANSLMSDAYVLPHSPVPNKHDASKKLRAQWDTGATGTVLSKKLAKELRLEAISIVDARGCGGNYQTNLYYVDVILPNKVRINKLPVTEAEFEDIDVLIGMDIINIGDLAISNYNGKTAFSYRFPSCCVFDFTTKSYLDPALSKSEPGRNELCPCGSGKKYKNCCLKKG